jgi:hypothetical protein
MATGLRYRLAPGDPESLKFAANFGELRFDPEPLPMRCFAEASELFDQEVFALAEQVSSAERIKRQ